MKTLSLVLILLILPIQVFGATTEEMNQQIASLLRELIALLQEKIKGLQKQLDDILAVQPSLVVPSAVTAVPQEPPYFVAEFLPRDPGADPAVFTIKTMMSNGQVLANQIFPVTIFGNTTSLTKSDEWGIIKFRTMQVKCTSEGIPPANSRIAVTFNQKTYSEVIPCIPLPPNKGFRVES